MEWTEELVARLRALWSQGLSTAEIGRQLDITKNAVVGKAHRLGLPPRPSPIRNKKEAESKATPRRRAAAVRSGEQSGKSAPKVEAQPATSKKTVHSAPKVTSSHAKGKSTPRNPEKAASAPKTARKADPADTVRQEKAATASDTQRPSSPRKTLSPRRARDSMERMTRQGPTCQWPHGNPGERGFHFCGAVPLPGKPYCAEHAAIAYVKIRDRRD